MAFVCKSKPKITIEQSYGHTAELIVILESEKLDLTIFSTVGLELETGDKFIKT
ncbi:hypothetical protein ACLBWZ_13815 [Brucellaceae bacterium C25G]